MEIAIVDDDLDFANKLRDSLIIHISKIDENTNVDIYSDKIEELELMSKYKIVFFDIDLVDQNGIDLARKTNRINPKCIVVFVSSKSHLVFDTLQIRPFFFIRKSKYSYDMPIFYDLIKYELSEEVMIDINYKSIKNRIPISEIVYVEAVNHCLIIHCQNAVYNDNRSLSEFMKCLNEFFVRVHKSYIINFEFMTSLKCDCVEMNNDITINIGRTYKNEFKSKYEDYLIK